MRVDGGDSGCVVVVVVLVVARVGVGVALVLVLFAEFRLIRDFPRGKSAIEIDSSI